MSNLWRRGAMSYARNFDACEAEAAKLGREVVLPTANQLQIDIDCDEAFRDFVRRFERLEEMLGGGKENVHVFHEIHPSPSGEPGHYHVTIELPHAPRSECERIFLQTLLGSDPMREALGWRRMVDGDPHPTLFFELPE